MTEVTFDIFRGFDSKDAMWVEAVPGLSNARTRMEEIAAEKPGRYFMFAPASDAIVARIETFPDGPDGRRQNARRKFRHFPTCANRST